MSVIPCFSQSPFVGVKATGSTEDQLANLLGLFTPFVHPVTIQPWQSEAIDEVADTDLASGAEASLIKITMQGGESMRISHFGQKLNPGGTSVEDEAFEDIEWRLLVNGSPKFIFQKVPVGETNKPNAIFLHVPQDGFFELIIKHTNASGNGDTHTVAARIQGWIF